MAIKLEEMMNEFRYPSQITTDKNIVTSGSITASNIVTSATGTSGSFTVNGALTVTGGLTANSLTATGTPSLGSTGTAGYTQLGSGGPQLISGTLAPPLNPTGISAPLGSLFINLGATGVTNRMYINTDGATGWTYLATSGA